MKNIEEIAKGKIKVYTDGLIVNGKVIVPGFDLKTAAKKAAEANPNFAKDIYKIAGLN